MDRQLWLQVKLWLSGATAVGGAALSLVMFFVFAQHGGSLPHQDSPWLMLGAPIVAITAAIQTVLIHRRLNAQGS